MNKEYSEKACFIIGKLQKEITFYELIFKLSQEQKIAIQNRDTDMLMGILHKKQDCMNSVDVIRKDLLLVKEEWERIKQDVDIALKQKVSELSSRLSFLLQNMVGLEKENIELASCQQVLLQREIGQLKTNHTAIKRYLTCGREPARAVMDKKL